MRGSHSGHCNKKFQNFRVLTKYKSKSGSLSSFTWMLLVEKLLSPVRWLMSLPFCGSTNPQYSKVPWYSLQDKKVIEMIKLIVNSFVQKGTNTAAPWQYLTKMQENLENFSSAWIAAHEKTTLSYRRGRTHFVLYLGISSMLANRGEYRTILFVFNTRLETWARN